MTGSDASDASPAGRKPLSKVVTWPLSVLTVGSAVLAVYNAFAQARIFWIFAGVFALIYLVILAFRFVPGFWLRWTKFRTKALEYDGLKEQYTEIKDSCEKAVKRAENTEAQIANLESELKRWKNAAFAATERAENAETQLVVQTLHHLHEGRRRILAEVLPMSINTEFQPYEVGIREGTLTVSAKWKGDTPSAGTRYVMQTGTIGEHKAMLECVEVHANQLAFFQVASTTTEKYRLRLMEIAESTSQTLENTEITPRDQYLDREQIWPEK